MSNLQKKFLSYNLKNPHVYELFKKLCFSVMKSGITRYSAKTVFERIRWHYDIDTIGDNFTINNNYVSFYVRKLVNECPEFESMFKLRKLRG